MPDVLVVDDEEEICEMLREELEKKNFSVASAGSGEEALRLLNEKKWDAAIVDLKLATAITGLEVIKAVRAKWPRAAVFAMTGYVDVALKQEAERLGVKGYLAKPDDIVKPDVLAGKLQSAMGQL